MKNMPVKKGSENLVVTLYYLFKIIPILVAAGTIYLGYQLFILGVTGQASLSMNSAKVSGQLLNAAPGLFFAIGGIVVLVVTVWKGVKISFTDGNDLRPRRMTMDAARKPEPGNQ